MLWVSDDCTRTRRIRRGVTRSLLPSRGSLIAVQLPISSFARLSVYELYQVYQTPHVKSGSSGVGPVSSRKSLRASYQPSRLSPSRKMYVSPSTELEKS